MKGLRLPFLGEHQLINAAVAVGFLQGLSAINLQVNYKQPSGKD